MNIRIREPFERSFACDDYVNVGPNGTELGFNFNPDKFAELIIQSCATIGDCAHLGDVVPQTR